ncbi:hypothetical protein D3C75_1346350 [compost metagenome]
MKSGTCCGWVHILEAGTLVFDSDREHLTIYFKNDFNHAAFMRVGIQYGIVTGFGYSNLHILNVFIRESHFGRNTI